MLPTMTLWRHRGRLLRAWWESPSGWRRIGRAALFAYALRVSVYLPVGVAFVDAGGAAFGRAMTFAFVYPALVVLWGFWRAHPVIGWSVWGLWGGTALFATFYALVYPGATLSFHPPSSNPFFPVHALGLSMWLDPIILPLMIVLWAWDRQLPLPLPDTVLETPVPARTRALLLGGAGAFMIWGMGLLLLLLYLEEAAGQGWGGRLVAAWPILGSLTTAQNPQIALVAFHILSLTLLSTMLWLGVWRRRSDIAEAGCWLLLPGQVITIGWMAGHPFLKAGTLTLAALYCLVRWHHGTPRILRRNRRAKWHTPEIRRSRPSPTLS